MAQITNVNIKQSRLKMTAFSSFLLVAIALLLVASSSSAQFADLVVSSGAPTVTPSQVTAGDLVTLSTWVVKNNGIGRAGRFQNGFYLSTDPIITPSDRYLDGNSNSSLLPGTSHKWSGPSLTIPENIAEGFYYIGILVDRAGEVLETNENNNYVSQQIYVKQCRDIEVMSFGLSGSTIILPEETIGSRLSAEVRYTGDQIMTSVTVGFYLSTDSIITTSDRLLFGGRESTGSLPAGGGSTVISINPSMRIPDNYPVGNVYLGILIDEFDQLDECDEGNNTAVIAVEIKEAPDLIITTPSPFTATPATVEPDHTTRLSSYSIANVGTATANGIKNYFYLSTDSIITPTDLYLTNNVNSSIAPSGSFTWGGATLTIPANTVPGSYYIGILTDAVEAIPEVNENNNYISVPITVEFATSVAEREVDALPEGFTLSQNYPNPFNPTTTIDFNLPKRADVLLEIYNVAGQRVIGLINESLTAGAYTIEWDGRDNSGSPVATGIYFYRLQAGEFTHSRKMVYLK